AAWSGGVMFGPTNCDDLGYADLLASIAKTGDVPAAIESERLREMIARGLGVEDAPAGREGLYAMVGLGNCIPALPYDLTFPEVFYPTGVPHGKKGFNSVLGNPPWDRMLPADKEFFAAFDFSILDAPTKRERESIQNRQLANPDVEARYNRYL